MLLGSGVANQACSMMREVGNSLPVHHKANTERRDTTLGAHLHNYDQILSICELSGETGGPGENLHRYIETEKTIASALSNS